MSAGYTDNRWLRNAGIPAYGISGLFSDPGNNGVHGRNEQVGVKAVFDSKEFLYRLVKLLAGPVAAMWQRRRALAFGIDPALTRHGGEQPLVVFADDAVAAAALGGVEADVGGLDQGLRRRAGMQGGDPDRDRQAASASRRSSADQFGLHDGEPQLLGHLDSGAQRRPRHDHGELFAPVARGDILARDGVFQRVAPRNAARDRRPT